MRNQLRLVSLALRVLAGPRFWLAFLLPLAWLLLQAVFLVTGLKQEGFEADSVQNFLIGTPLIALAIGLGGRIIAGELDSRTLEVAYTVPGGARRVWSAKLAAAGVLLTGAALLMAAATAATLTTFPIGALYGALQGATFYLVLAMALAALFRGQAAGAMVSIVVLALNLLLTGFGSVQSRLSPLYNPLALPEADPSELFAWTLQNRLGALLAIAAIIALAFVRAERREKMLSGS